MSQCPVYRKLGYEEQQSRGNLQVRDKPSAPKIYIKKGIYNIKEMLPEYEKAVIPRGKFVRLRCVEVILDAVLKPLQP